MPFSSSGALAVRLLLQTPTTPATEIPDAEVPRVGIGKGGFEVWTNWFFEGLENKATLDLSRLTLEQPGAPELSDFRIRLQWDISF